MIECFFTKKVSMVAMELVMLFSFKGFMFNDTCTWCICYILYMHCDSALTNMVPVLIHALYSAFTQLIHAPQQCPDKYSEIAITCTIIFHDTQYNWHMQRYKHIQMVGSKMCSRLALKDKCHRIFMQQC
ncbi:hypothetical protein NP493_2093g00008 [Ridgeia piscesae]|uniref:Uncharacterized protein n=1 Tax=Ridgeia piscesae TaxID=27915 RepID=A0AAD9JNJ0_RIDPI|nr:hypothetical protein NP493_3492g00000 [Ridgeia piscesae]KAK2155280.1 hypothetical protein NP493_2093g00008 [Ridgeia piscesae]